MAIKVRNNLAAMRSLGQLNINITELGKALTKVSSGQKINSAGDDASGLAISEQMRVRIRALNQDVQNVKNGSSMLEIASGGVGNIVDVLREMKKLAIDAANDSNSDEDRRTIQKELTQRMLTINDVAIGTAYNGKRLIDGTYDVREITESEQVGWLEPPRTFTMVPGKTYSKTVNADGSRVFIGVNNLQNMAGNFKPVSSGTYQLSNPISGTGIECDTGFSGYQSTWNWADAYRDEQFDSETELTYFENTETSPSTPQQVIRALMHSFDDTTLRGTAAFDEAIEYCTGGTITSKDELVQKFMDDLANSSSADDFLQTYCDIILSNTDTGAITGSDAGGGSTKTAESIVPEHGFPVTSHGVPTGTTTINGLNVNWPSYGVNGTSLSSAEEHILKALNSDWIEQAVQLVSDSYNIDFNQSGTTVNTINVVFENQNNGTLAYVSSTSLGGRTVSLDLVVNMYYYSDIDPSSEDGDVLPTSSISGVTYLDRTIAHEFTHAIMAANIDYFGELPLYVIEGTAELTHGIDDERAYTINRLLTTDTGTLQSVLSSGGSQSDGEVPYAAGYMLLRYLAKQGQGQSISKVETTYPDQYSSPTAQGYEIGVEIDFSASSLSDPTETLSIPSSFDEQAISILCGGCGQYINIAFDADTPIGTGTLQTYSTDTARKDYTVGISDATTYADLARAIFEGIANAPGRDTTNDVYVTHEDGTKELVCVSIDPAHNVRIAKNPYYPDSSDNEYVFLKENQPELDFIDRGLVEVTGGAGSKDDAPEGTEYQELDDYGEEIFDENGNKIPHVQIITVEEDTEVNIWEADWVYYTRIEGEPLVIHDGTRAGQRNHFYIKNMQTKALTAGKIFDQDYAVSVEHMINESDRAHYEALSNDPDKQLEWLGTLKQAANMTVDDILVTTVKDANIAIRVLDGAIEYALDNATRLGAYLQRLETDESNIVTSNENVTAAESTIRDADMAKEMTSYTKANVLSQAAQAMLAQANQNSSAVLSLLR